MKFKANYDGGTYDLINFVERHLDGSDYERGALEAAQGTADNVAKAFGRFLNLMVERKVLDKSDIYTILDKTPADGFE